MASPFVVSPLSYGDLVNGGELAPIIFAGRIPTSQDIKPAGYFWLSDQTLGGNGALYYQSGFTSGAPNWVLLSQAGAGVFTTVTASGNITSTAGNISATAGSVSAGTTLTATLGNITATNGNIVKGSAGNKDVYSSVASTTTAGANSAGTVTLVGGTATISTTAVTASSIIRIYRQGVGATGAAALGILSIGTITAGTSFVINAVQAANATALQASDVSVIAWEIVN